MNVYYCNKCKKVEVSDKGKSCATCGEKMIPLDISLEEWNLLSEDGMMSCIAKAMENNKPSKMPVNNGVALVPGICPQCGGKVKVDKNKDAAICEHCGTPFIVEKAITIVNNNIQIVGENVDDFVDRIKERDKTLKKRVSKVVPLVKEYCGIYQKMSALNREHDRKMGVYYSNRSTAIVVGVIMSPFAIIMLLNDVFAMGMMALLLDLVLVSCCVYNGRRNRNEAEWIIGSALEELAERASECYDEISMILPELPKEYYYQAAVEYIEKIINTNRADNMREALAMLDEQIHRWNMESMAQQSLIIQQQQKAAIDALWWQGFVNSI